MAKRDLCKSKETYTNQKRPINGNPTTHMLNLRMRKRCLLEMAKRDLCKSKETYANQKRPINNNPTHQTYMLYLRMSERSLL